MNHALGSSVSYMRRADAVIFIAASLIALCTPLLFSSPAYAASAVVDVSGTITGNTTWSPSDGIYFVDSDITIPFGSSLTILPGTIVKMNYHTSITNQGSLKIGDVGARAYITSIADDTVGGDTNADGYLTEPHTADWGRIETMYAANTTVVNTTLRYAGWAFFAADMFLNSGGLLSIKDSTLSNDYLLINSEGGTTTISNSSLTNAFNGVYVGGGSGRCA